MQTKETFIQHLETGYQFKGAAITLGGSIFNGETLSSQVKVPLKTFNRHGLIAGATGTGKTKSLQVLAEQLSENGVPVVLMDLKGDLSGLAQPGTEKDFITQRHQKINIPYATTGFPVELLTLSKAPGIKLRATVTEFGPVLFSKILDLNETQQSVISLIFKYCDDHKLPMIDLKDLKKTLQFIIGEGKEIIEKEYGAVSPSTVNTIQRKLIELEQQGAETFFGEPSFDVNDLTQMRDGKGVISILRLTDIQDKPQFFSTFMLSLLSEIYATFPEIGDPEKPELVLFIDEAHLIFDNASKALLQQLEAIIKLIRSKGVGIYFCTQVPADVPQSILSQLGLKIQHALRAFTAKDRKDIEQAAENFPLSDFYKTDEILTQLGIGEALVTSLNEKGIPTPLVACCMRAPQSRMDILTSDEIQTLVAGSALVKKYDQNIDRESAYELLSKKIASAQSEDQQKELQQENKKAIESSSDQNEESGGWFSGLSKNTFVRQVGGILVREVTRGLLGALGVKSSRRTTKRR
jgi:DNA helicase HerA-like ATPase